MRICILSPVTIPDYKELLYDKNIDLPMGLKYAVMTPLVKYFIEKGHEVVICTLDKNISKEKIYRGPNLTIYVGRYGKYGKVRAFTKFSYEINQMVNFLKKNPCDIYNAHWSYEFALAALKVNSEKTIVSLHDWAEAIYDLDHQYYRKKRLEMNNIVCNKAKYFTGISPYITDYFKHKYNKKIELIPNCIDDSFISKEEKKINDKSLRIIGLNNGFDKRKNTQNLIIAFNKMQKVLPNITLEVYGRGYEKDGDAYRWANEHKLASNIIFGGRISHIEAIKRIRESDLLIHSSLEESLGMIFVESMVNKTPCIGGKESGAVPWVLNYGKAGSLVNVKEPSDIAKEAISILKDQKLWSNYSNNGYEHAIKNFSVNVIGDKYLNLYRKIY